MSAQGDLLRFSVHGGQKKLLGCGLLGGISTQVDTMLSNELNFSVAVYIYKIHVLMEHFLLTFPFNYQNVYGHQTFQDGNMLQGAA